MVCEISPYDAPFLAIKVTYNKFNKSKAFSLNYIVTRI